MKPIVAVCYRLARGLSGDLPAELGELNYIDAGEIDPLGPVGASLFEGDSDALLELARWIACRDEAIVPVYELTSADLDAGDDYELIRLFTEQSRSIDAATAGWSASLMAIEHPRPIPAPTRTDWRTPPVNLWQSTVDGRSRNKDPA